jgi:hypothetical protein
MKFKISEDKNIYEGTPILKLSSDIGNSFQRLDKENKRKCEHAIYRLFAREFWRIFHNTQISKKDISKLKLRLDTKRRTYGFTQEEYENKWIAQMDIYVGYFGIYSEVLHRINKIKDGEAFFRATSTHTSEINVDSYEDAVNGLKDGTINDLGLYWSWDLQNTRSYNIGTRTDPEFKERPQKVLIKAKLIDSEKINIDASLLSNFNFRIGETEIRLLTNTKIEILEISKLRRVLDADKNYISEIFDTRKIERSLVTKGVYDFLN